MTRVDSSSDSGLPHRVSALALVALALAVLGTIGFFTVDMRAILLPLAAIAMAILAIRRIRDSGERGRWVAIAAIIVGAIAPIATLLLLFGLFAAAMADT